MSVVLVPGLGGSVLSNSGKRVWPTLDAALPFLRSKWKTMISTSLGENSISGNPKVQPLNFGGLESVENLYEVNWKIFDFHMVDYFREIVDFLQSQGVQDIHGAPYDFRLLPDPSSMKEYFSKLKKLIEKLQNPATIIAHSLGVVVSTIFLNRQSKKWKNSYISRFVSISGPFGVATKAIHACLTGDTETPINISTEFYRQIEIGFGGVLWMINNPEVFSEDIVNDLNPNQLGVALVRRGSKNSAMVFENLIRPLHKEALKYPGVPVCLIYGTGIGTMYKLRYSSKDFSDTPKIKKCDGDGTVPLKSLQAVSFWRRLAGKNSFQEFNIYRAEHLSILKSPELLKILGSFF